MSGQQLDNTAIGRAYEDFAGVVVGRIASMIPVPRTDDYGIDFYCLPRVPVGSSVHTVANLCSIQVKGGSAALPKFGGLDEEGRWRRVEIEWLRSLHVPLYLALVDAAFTSVDLYSMWHLWCVFWKSEKPFMIRLVVETPNYSSRFGVPEPSAVEEPKAVGQADGRVWTVELGPPFLHLTLRDLEDIDFRQKMAEIFHHRTSERQTLINLHAGLPNVSGATRWLTNEYPPCAELLRWAYWNRAPGGNIDRLVKLLGPIIGNLALNLQEQGNADFARMLPVLEYLAHHGQLDYQGEIVLKRLTKF
jgi:hypothetical protein